MMLLQFVYWVIIITMEKEVFHRIIQKEWNGDMKKVKFHYEAAAMAGHEVARYMLQCLEAMSGNMERAIKHWSIAASAGNFTSMNTLRLFFEKGEAVEM
jgi:hypothetical protein